MDILFNPDKDNILEIRDKLINYNEDFLEIDDELQFVIEEKDENDNLIGGIFCVIIGQWLEVEYLWVDKKHRYKGMGSELLRKAEDIAIDKDCNKISLTTYSFQAKPFYEKLGYEVKYIQENYPRSSVKYFMEKELY